MGRPNGPGPGPGQNPGMNGMPGKSPIPNDGRKMPPAGFPGGPPQGQNPG